MYPRKDYERWYKTSNKYNEEDRNISQTILMKLGKKVYTCNANDTIGIFF